MRKLLLTFTFLTTLITLLTAYSHVAQADWSIMYPPIHVGDTFERHHEKPIVRFRIAELIKQIRP